MVAAPSVDPRRPPAVPVGPPPVPVPGAHPGKLRSARAPGWAARGAGAVLLVALLLVTSFGPSLAAAPATPRPPPPALVLVTATPTAEGPRPPGPGPEGSLSERSVPGWRAGAPGSVGVATDDVRVVNTTLLQAQVTAPSGPTAPADISIWLEEPISPTVVAAVGLRILGSAGGPSCFGEFAVYVSGVLSTLVVNRSSSIAPGSTVTLSFGETLGPWWTFTVGGERVQYGGANGTVDLGSSEAIGLDPGAAPVGSPTLLGTSDGNVTFPRIDAPLALGVWGNGTFTAPGDGVAVASGSSWGSQGFDQNASLAPDELVLDGGLSALSPGTYLWGVGGPGFPSEASWTSTAAPALGGYGAAWNLTLPSTNASGVVGGSFCAVLVLPLDLGVNLTAGLCWRDAPGRLYAFEKVASVAGTFQADPVGALPGPGETAMLEVAGDGTGNWNVSVNGQSLPPPGSNGTLYAGSPAANRTVAPSAAIWAGGPLTALPPELLFPAALEVVPAPGTAPVPLDLGVSGPVGSSTGIEGNAQNWSVAPGALRIAPGAPRVGAGTPLWNSTTSPPLVVAVVGAPSSAPSGAPSQLRLWANLSGGGGPASPSRLMVHTDPWGPASVVALGPGLWGVGVIAPMYGPSGSSWTIELNASAPGHAPAGWTTTVPVVPGSLSVAYASAGGPSVLDDVATPLHFWVNASYPGGGPVAGANLSLATSLGGNLTGFASVGPGAFVATFQPVLTPVPVNNTLIGSANATGFLPLTVHLLLPVRPAPLAVGVAPVARDVPAGSTVNVTVWANGTGGPVAGVGWSATYVVPLVVSSNLVVATGGVRPDGGRNLTLLLPTEAATTSGLLLLNASSYGYVGAGAAVAVNLTVATLSVVFAPVGPIVAGTTEAALSFHVQDASGAPVVGVQVVLTLPAGAGGLASATARSGAQGDGTFAWYPPAGPGTWTASYATSARGFASAQGTLVLTVTKAGGSAGAFWLSPAVLALAIGGGVGVAVLLFLLVGQLRWRRGGRARRARRGRQRPRSGRPSPKPRAPAHEEEAPTATAGPSTAAASPSPGLEAEHLRRDI